MKRQSLRNPCHCETVPTARQSLSLYEIAEPVPNCHYEIASPGTVLYLASLSLAMTVRDLAPRNDELNVHILCKSWNKLLRLITPYIPVVGLYGLIIAVVFGRALFPRVGEMIWGDDIHGAYYFFRQFFNSFLREGIWPWWNPYTFGGAPFIADPIVNIWYPPTWLFFFFPLNIAYSWHIALHIVWAMTGMYVLLRCLSSPRRRGSSVGEIDSRFRGNDTFQIAPWVGGLIFGLSGFFMPRTWAGHVDIIAAASWMPWVVWAFSRRGVILPAAFFALQILAGYQTMAFFTLEAVAVMTLFFCLAKPDPASRDSVVKRFRPLLRMMLAVLIALGLAAVQLVPEIEFVRQSIRSYSLPYSWVSYGSITWESLKQLLNPFFFGDQRTYHGPPPNYGEHAMFVGRVGILFVLIAMVVVFIRFLSSPRKRGSSLPFRMDSGSPHQRAGQAPAGMTAIVAFFVIALFGLWVALGPNAPIDLQKILWTLVPIYHSLRIPPRHLILVVFGLSGLISLSISYLSDLLSSRRTPGSSVKKILDSRFRGNDTIQFFPILLVVIITIEMILYARHFITLKPIPEARHDAELVKILKQDTQPFRVLSNFGMWIPPRDSLDFDSTMQYRIFSATGYDPSILRSYYEYIDLANGNAPGSSILTHDVQVPYLNVFSQATDFLNIKYILVPRAYDTLYGVKTDRFVLLREDVKRDYRLYENKTVKPRFFFEGGKEGRVEIKKYSPNEIVLSTDNKTGETLFSSEVFYPGWEGFVDGKKVDVIKTNHAFRALFVPAGKHSVIYRYSPRIFLIGGLISLMTLVVCLLLIYPAKNRRITTHV